MAVKIKKGDKVLVLAGRDKGKVGDVMRVIRKDGRALVQGVNVAKRHMRASQTNPGGIVDKEMSPFLTEMNHSIRLALSRRPIPLGSVELFRPESHRGDVAIFVLLKKHRAKYDIARIRR